MRSRFCSSVEGHHRFSFRSRFRVNILLKATLKCARAVINEHGFQRSSKLHEAVKYGRKRNFVICERFFSHVGNVNALVDSRKSRGLSRLVFVCNRVDFTRNTLFAQTRISVLYSRTHVYAQTKPISNKCTTSVFTRFYIRYEMVTSLNDTILQLVYTS